MNNGKLLQIIIPILLIAICIIVLMGLSLFYAGEGEQCEAQGGVVLAGRTNAICLDRSIAWKPAEGRRDAR